MGKLLDDEGFAGERKPGLFDPNEPRPVQALSARLRVLHRYQKGLDKDMHFISRIKDLHFDTGPIVVRNGKGQKDRVTVLPKSVSESLSGVVEETKKLHKQDLQAGFGGVYLPFAISRKYPNANRETAWQYVFPSRQR